MDIDIKAFFEKMRRIEALHAGATTPGERDAAANAIQCMRERLKAIETEDPPVEYKFTLADSWSRKLFLAIARARGSVGSVESESPRPGLLGGSKEAAPRTACVPWVW